MADVESAISTMKTLQAALSTLTALAMTAYRFPPDTATEDLLTSVDYAVIGGGSAGCVIANRLSEDGNCTVLVIEAGDVSPAESMMPGMFTFEPYTKYDWNQSSYYDGFSTQNMANKVAGMTAGKMLGGSSCNNHLIQARGNIRDYSKWANKTNDDSWSYENLLPYFIKYENVLDEDILDCYPSSHGTSGPLKLKTQRSPENIPILEAFKELNHNILVDINNANEFCGYLEPQLTIADGIRCSASIAYMSDIQNRTNLYVKYNTLARKIIFDSNNRAIGVQILDSENVTKTIHVKKEVIVSAGAIRTPQLLVLSGIGDQETLDKLGVDMVANLPVGKGLKDHCSAVTVYTLGTTNETTASNYHEFPVPMTTGYVGLNSSEYPDYQAITLLCHQNSAGCLQLCMWVFGYNNDICQAIYDANKEKEILFVVNNILQPISEGQVIINCTDPRASPIVKLGLLSNERDVNVLAQSLMDFDSITSSSYFKSLNSTMVDLNLTNCNGLNKSDINYWKCYSVAMSSTLWHYCSSCAMGTVLNPDLTVKNTTNLRVVDASAMPDITSGNIMGAVYVLAEKAAEMIKQANNHHHQLIRDPLQGHRSLTKGRYVHNHRASPDPLHGHMPLTEGIYGYNHRGSPGPLRGRRPVPEGRYGHNHHATP